MHVSIMEDILIHTILENNIIAFYRWHNHLNPYIKKDAWTLEEELALMNAHRLYGNKWAEIAKVLPGRQVIASWKFSR